MLGSLVLPKAAQALPPLCSWSQNGCTVTVWQWDDGWGMVADCGGEGGAWSGPGQWGGVCH